MSPFAGRHTCVFAGAGCSKALFDMPIQAELVKDFLAWDMRSASEQHLSQTLRCLLSAMNDIELVVSHYHNLAYPESSKRNNPVVRELMFLRVALAQYLDDRMNDKHAKYKALHEGLLASFLKGRGLRASDLFVVTTNYDLVLERILEDIFGAGSYWYPGVSRGSQVDGIPILKLHGSINWLENRGLARHESFTRKSQEILIESPSALKLTRSPWDNGSEKEKEKDLIHDFCLERTPGPVVFLSELRQRHRSSLSLAVRLN
jgi:SIR2-like domain